MASRRQEKTIAAAAPERLLQAKLPADLVKALRILALERDTTVKDLLTRIVQDYLDRQGRPPERKGQGR
jgi:hypothetical protein